MCQVSLKAKRVKRAIRAYKYAPWRSSQYEPKHRGPIKGFRAVKGGRRGEFLTYEIGTTVKSPSGPGIMAYLKKPFFSNGYLVIRIPKGALVRYGDEGGEPIIAASKVYVVGEA